MKYIQMIRSIELLDFCAVGCAPTGVFEADDSNCLQSRPPSQFNPTESDDIDGAKEPLSSLDVSNAENDTNAFGVDVKIEQVAVPFEIQADQIIFNSPEESTVIHKAYCSDSSSNNATSFQISPAKEDEIEAARIRMEAYMAKRRSQMKTTTKVTSPNNMNQISQPQSDEVSGDVPVEDAATTIARKIDPKTTVADNLDKTSKDEMISKMISGGLPFGSNNYCH